MRCAAIVVALLCAASAAAAPIVDGEDGAKSLKERLSDKASDEQRVNNCRVPLDRRGPKPRPDCPEAKLRQDGSAPPATAP